MKVDFLIFAKGIMLFIFAIYVKECWSINEKVCLDGSKFEFCSADKTSDNLFWNLYTGHDLYFKILSPGYCLSYGFIYLWKLRLLCKSYQSLLGRINRIVYTVANGRLIQKFDKFNNKAVLSIKNGVLSANEYNMEVTIKGTRKHSTIINCWFRIISSGVIPIIIGGQYRNAMDGDKILLDGTVTDEAGVAKLKYKWQCTSGVLRPSCKKFHSTKKRTQITVSGNAGEIYNVTLNVYAAGISKTTYQLIHIVHKGLPLIYISCEANCLGKGHVESDPAQTLFLKANCIRNCDGISYEWSVSNGIDEDDTVEGFFDPRLLVDMYVMEFDEPYDMEVQALINGKATKAKAKWSLRTATVPNKSCEVRPTHGTSLKTVFELECSGPKHTRPLTYIVDQLYQRPQDQYDSGVFITQSMVPRLSMFLAPENYFREVMVFVRDDKYSDMNIPSTVTVEPLLAHLPDEEIMREVINIYNGRTGYAPSVRAMAKHGWSDRSLQIVNCLLWEMENIQSEEMQDEFALKFKYKILVDFLMFPVSMNLKGLTTLLPMFMDYTRPKRVHHAVILSTLCKRLSIGVREYMASAKYPMLKSRTARTLTSILIDCSDYLLDGYFRKRHGYDITTELPSDIHRVIEEDYPNYKDIIDSQLREKYVDITNNAIRTIQECTFAFSMGLAYGQSVTIGYTNKIIMQLGKIDEIQMNFSSDPGVEVYLPQNLGLKREENLRILFISFDNEIYFWDSIGQNITTRIVDLDIYNEKNELLTQLPDYIDAYMDIVDHKETAVQVGAKVEVAGGGLEWTEKDITVYRISVFKKAQLFADINDVGLRGIEVVVTQNRRPNLEDFKNARTFKRQGRLQFPVLEYDTWCYIGILPSKPPMPRFSPLMSTLRYLWSTVSAVRSKRQVTNFKYTFKTQSCLEWTGSNWKGKNCSLGMHTTTDQIHCRCTSLTKVAGVTYTPPSKVDVFNDIDFKIEFTYSYFIFIMTAAILLCYFIAMCFIIFRVRPASEIYFLSDNIKDERYAYLVIAKTGKTNHSGTSSNVTIKLHGEKRSSKAHVLNYPDPDKRLLQHMNEDWFILTTSLHLGELSSIELWFDSIGSRPRWYCKWIRICDLQLEKWWFFDVQSWFTVLKPERHFYKIDCTDPRFKKKKTKKYYLLKYFNFYFGSDNTWNLFAPSDDYNLTYSERITVILSNILFTYSLALLICVTPEMRLRDGFTRHFLNSYLEVIGCAVAISLLSSGVHALFVFAFRNSSRNRSSEFKKALLPNYVVNLAWRLLIVFVLLEILYLTAFGFWASETACMVWFMMATIAILISIFIWENVYIIIAATFEKEETAAGVMHNYKKIIYETEQQRKGLYQFAGFYGLRPYLTHLYKPLDDESFQKKQERLRDHMILSKAFRDMLLFALYLFFLFVLVYENTDPMSVLHNNHIRTLMEADDLDTPLEDIASNEDLYDYLNNSLIPTIQAINWYGDWIVMDSGLISDFSTKVLGVARIRQKRVLRDTCHLTELAHWLNVTDCKPELTSRTADKRNFGGKLTMWTYVPPLEAGVTITYGFIRSYTGGGYIATLGRNINNAYYIIDRLLIYKWIDDLTRVIFIEFWTYNANSNLFNTVKVVVESSATQFRATSTEVYTNRLMHVDVKHEIMPVIAFSIFMIIVFYQFCNCVTALITQRLRFFKRFWNFVDLTILIMSVSLVILTIHKMQLVIELLALLNRTKRNKFINYYPVLYYDKLLTLMSALLICIATFRTWKYFRFGVMFRVFERTLVKQLKPLLGLFVYNTITLSMFSLAGYISFSSFSSDFRNLEVTFTTMMLLSLNLKSGENFDLKILQQYAPTAGPIYYVSFALVMLLIVNVYITIIIIYYEESLEHFTQADLKYSVLDYARDEFRYLSRYFGRYITSLRLKGGQESSEKVTPKNCRYTDSHVMDDKDVLKMIALATGTIHNFFFRKNTSELDDRDLKIMAKVAHLTLRDSNRRRKHIFFLMSEEGKERKMIPDDRLLEMEKIVRKIFKEETDDNKSQTPPQNIDQVTLKKLENLNKLLNIINRIVGNINIVNVRRK